MVPVHDLDVQGLLKKMETLPLDKHIYLWTMSLLILRVEADSNEPVLLSRPLCCNYSRGRAVRSGYTSPRGWLQSSNGFRSPRTGFSRTRQQ